MAVLVNRSYLQASSANLATDLARYGSNATWRGVYYRGEKIGFTVSQTLPTGDGFEIQEDGRLQMSLLGATTAAAIRTTARVDREFRLRSFDFSLDPGTGPIRVQGEITEGRSTVRLTASAEAAAVRRSASGESYGGSAEPSGEGGSLTRRRKADTTPRADTTLTLTITSPSGTRTEERELDEPPALSLNLARRLASGGLTPGVRHQWTMFDPATLRNAPVTIVVGEREVVRAGLKAIPAFRVEMEFAGLRTTAWVTDTGEVVREHSPLGLMTIREPAERARAMAVPMDVQSDLLRASAVVPAMQYRIDETREVTRLRLRIDGLDEARLSSDDLQGAGQTAGRGEIEIRDFKTLAAGPADPGARRHLAPEPLVESDAPEILDEAARAVAGVAGTRARRAPHALRERAAREEADGEPALRARGPAHEGGRLQRAHGALRGDGTRAGHPRADRGGPHLRPRRLLLSRVAGGLYR